MSPVVYFIHSIDICLRPPTKKASITLVLSKDEQSIFTPSMTDSSDCDRWEGPQRSQQVGRDLFALKDKKWTVLSDRNQLKLKEMRLQKIMKLVDTCAIPAFQASTSSSDQPTDPVVTPSIFQVKLLKWIEELESFDV
jgi:hypothetical protein